MGRSMRLAFSACASVSRTSATNVDRQRFQIPSVRSSPRFISRFYSAIALVWCLQAVCFLAPAQADPDTPDIKKPAASASTATPSTLASIPESLKPWIPWVLATYPDLACASVRGQSRCVWPREVTLSVRAQGASFTMQGFLDREQPLILPGSSLLYPKMVRGQDGQLLPVLSEGGRPTVKLPAGTFRVTGSYDWSEMPRNIQLPTEVALVSLDLHGRKVANPAINERGELWLVDSVSSDVAEQDVVQLAVFRRLEDGVPFRILTALSLRIAGKVRDVALGNILPEASTLVGVTSDLAVRFDQAQGVVVQARPGTYTIRFESLLATPPSQVSVPQWSVADFNGDEVWVWKSNEEFRSVQLTGGVLIDASRTELPSDWVGLTTYAMAPGQALSFAESRRGEVEQGTNFLELSRTVWLPLIGSDLIVRDEISGTMKRGWRLDADPSLKVGRVSLDGRDQLITSSTGLSSASASREGSGVEVRSERIKLVAESQLSASLSDLPVASWDHAFESASVTLKLPPGWEVLHISGADYASAGWLSSWSLLNVFLVLLAAIATAKLIDKSAGLVVLCGLVLLHGQSGSPQMLYFHLLAAFALVRFLPDSNFKRFLKFHYAATLVLFGVMVVTFSFHHILQAVFPSVLPPGSNLYGFLEPFFYLVEQTFTGWIMFTLFVWGAQLFFTGNFFAGVIYGVSAVLLMMVVGLSASFTGVGGDMYQTGMMSSASRAIPEVMSYAYQSAEEGLMDGNISAPMSRKSAHQSPTRALTAIDPQAVVQTGPGLPEWQWRDAQFGWTGRVDPGYSVSILAIGPFGNAVLSFLRVALLLVILALFARRSSNRWWASLTQDSSMPPTPSMSSPVASLLAGGLLLGLLGSSIGVLPAQLAHAQSSATFPDSALLGELRDRLVKDRCSKDCVSINQASFVVEGRNVNISMQVSSDGAGAVALPGPTKMLFLEKFVINGVSSSAIRRESDGSTWMRVGSGVNQVELSGMLRSTESVTIQFPLAPQVVSVQASGWNVDGVSPTGTIRDSIQLTRMAQAESKEAEVAQLENDATSWFSVTRALSLGLPWEVHTTVSRGGNTDRPDHLTLGLLPGESVVSSGSNVADGRIQLSFARGVRDASWVSTVKPLERVVLTAAAEARVSETWELRCSAIWSCVVEGLAPERSVLDGQSGWRFRPYAGESVTVAVTRPPGVAGKSSTVERVRHEIVPGVRSLSGTVLLTVRASQGGLQELVLPEGASLSKVTVNSRDETTRFTGPRLELPITPGASELRVEYRTELASPWALRVPRVELAGASANVSTSIERPMDRWLLYTSGQGMGPVVLFWAKFLAIILFAILLGRLGLGPFGTKEWLLLGLGLSTLPIPLMLVPVLWVWLLVVRVDQPRESVFGFNLMQIALSILTLVVLMLLYRAVENGLIFSPDMMIQGQGSSSSQLLWYQDYASDSLPQPLMIAAPMWLWRAVMLAWSMWLVFSLIRWLRWGFECFSSQELWKKSSAGKPPPAATTTI